MTFYILLSLSSNIDIHIYICTDIRQLILRNSTLN